MADNLILALKASKLPFSVAYDFDDAETNVWTDMSLKPVFGLGPEGDTNPPAGSTFAFYVNTSSNVVVFDGTVPTTLTETVTEGAWTRFTVNSDHNAGTWDLYLNGTLIASGLGFYGGANPGYSEFVMDGGGVVDDISIGTSNPLPPATTTTTVAPTTTTAAPTTTTVAATTTTTRLATTAPAATTTTIAATTTTEAP